MRVGQSPQRRVRRGDFGEEHRVAHLHHAHLGHGHSAFPLAAVGHALAVSALYQRPLVVLGVGAVVHVQVGQHADVRAAVLACIPRERLAPVVGVFYVQVVCLSVNAVRSGNALRALFSLQALEPRPLVVLGVNAVLLGEVHVCAYVHVGSLLHPRAVGVGRVLYVEIRGAAVLPRGAGYALLALVHLQQPVGVAFRRLAVGAALVDAQPYPAVMAHAVVVVVVPGLPRTPLVRRHHRRAVRLHLRHRAREVHVVQVHRVPLHVHVELGQIAEVAVLQRHVPLRYLPRVLLPQHPRVRPRLVHRRLPAFVSKAAVADEIHHLKRVVSMRPSFACRAHLITELLVVVAYHFRYGEVNSAESGERPVAASVVSVRSGILGLGQRVVYSHADVAHGHSSYLAVLQFQRHGLSRGVHTFYDSAAWGAPLVAHLDVNPVVD